MNLFVNAVFFGCSVYILTTVLRLFYWRKYGLCARVLHEYLIQVSKLPHDNEYFKGMNSAEIDIVKTSALYYAALVKSANSRKQAMLVRKQMEQFMSEAVYPQIEKNDLLAMHLYLLTVHFTGIIYCTSFIFGAILTKLSYGDSGFGDTVKRCVNIARSSILSIQSRSYQMQVNSPQQVHGHQVTAEEWRAIHQEVVGKIAA